jgi:hypothetical protein
MKAVISEEPPIKIVADKKHPNMYRLQWKDGSLSVKYSDPNDQPMPDNNPVSSYGMYNLTRAKDILRRYGDYVDEMKLGKRSNGNSFAIGSRSLTGALF